jgi:cytochrome c556
MAVRAFLVALAVALGVGTAMAEQDPATVREDLMKQNNKHAIAVVR